MVKKRAIRPRKKRSADKATIRVSFSFTPQTIERLKVILDDTAISTSAFVEGTVTFALDNIQGVSTEGAATAPIEPEAYVFRAAKPKGDTPQE